ncbi:helix-turn-helix domain-containing protein [Microbacterium sp. 22179]|uniref:helix-turn-helix domain-containing protein n=1 Tax=Microbacterium sp. 22179 TaxID=3453886 RepID=UPI003F82EE2A
MTHNELEAHWEYEAPAAHGDARDIGEWTASCNLRSQEQLFVALAVANSEAGISSGVVAERLGISPADVDDIIHGRTDLTLTELRLFSLAAEVVVTYRVTPARSEWTRVRSAFTEMTAAHRSFVTRHYDSSGDSSTIDPLEVARKALAAR